MNNERSVTTSSDLNKRSNKSSGLNPPLDSAEIDSNRDFTPVYRLTAGERESMCEYLRYAIESLRDVITFERLYGNRAPILRVLSEYADDATALLARLQP
jgi:hypothetical protein